MEQCLMVCVLSNIFNGTTELPLQKYRGVGRVKKITL
jgi:hypothetical protein